MWIRDFVISLRLAFRDFDFDIQDEELERFMRICYDRCHEWFGPPPDPHRPMVLSLGPNSGCTRDALTRGYLIVISRNYTEEAERFGAVAHEVYHRMTWKRWIHRERYLDEMMAFLTEQKLLRELGYERHARQQEWEIRSRLEILRGESLRRARIRKRWIAGFNSIYPDGWYAGTKMLGLDLNKQLGWDSMTRLVRAGSVQAWAGGLPDSVRPEVLRAMGYE